MPDRYDVRFEWGPAGAAALAPSSSCLVVVDVLSFSTSVTSRGWHATCGLSASIYAVKSGIIEYQADG
jgi:hypothetical protein